MDFDNSYAAVDLSAIGHNIEAVKRKVGVPVMAIVKANAYGHGAVPVARYLEDKCDFFGVASLAEALELRKAGIRLPILILGYTPTDALSLAIEADIRPTIVSFEDAKALSAEAVKLGKTARFHFALDTGMSRIGFQPTEEDAEQCAEAAKLPGIFAEGLFSHFATADSADLSAARAQTQLYDGFVAMLEKRGVRIPICHLNNSAGLMNFTRHYDMVRSGIVTYGMYPSDEVDPALLALRPALTWHTRITQVKTVEAGRRVSYGGTYVTTRPTDVATVCIGYADGYRRSLSGKFHVLVNGKKAPILGRICMDQLMVDVTGIEDVRVGTVVTLIGRQGDCAISAEEFAAACGSFNYEAVCGISRRVPRYYYENGQLTHKVNYLLDE